MEATTRSAIEGILGKYDASQAASNVATARRATEREEFLAKFEKTATDTIRPTMQEIADLLISRGHQAKIIAQKEKHGLRGLERRAGIRLEIIPRRDPPVELRGEPAPHVGFFVEDFKNEIYVHESDMYPGKGGHAGPAGTYQLEAITPVLVEKHINTLLGQLLHSY